MKKLFPLLLTALVLSCKNTAPTQEISVEERIQRIENGLQPNLQIEGDSVANFNIEARMKELGIPAVTIAVVNNGQIEWAKAYGMADAAANRPATTETLFLAGSISKPVAATRAHQLAEEGTIDLDTNINQYLKSWQLPDNEFTEKEKVTTRRILNHTAGLTVWGFPGYDKGDTIPSVQDVLDGKGNTDSVRVYKEPGESWMYSGGGYTIMQLMITDVDQQSYPELMQSNVLDPLGMTKSTFANPLPEKYHSIAATGYRMNGDEVEGKWPIYPEMAAAGLWTTPSQLILWAQEMQNIYQNKEDGLLKVATVNDMLTPGMNDHGLGPSANKIMFGHGGADEGFRAQMYAWKDEPVAVVVMVNSDNYSIIQEILLGFAKEYNLPGIEPMLRKRMKTSTEALQKFAGDYNIPEFGDFNIAVKGLDLEVTGDFLDNAIIMIQESDAKFFDQKDGDYFDFEFKDDQVTGFKVQRFTATKLND
ncbi:hypothetical protein KH5_12490 [Urechidicola sp. KH5]